MWIKQRHVVLSGPQNLPALNQVSVMALGPGLRVWGQMREQGGPRAGSNLTRC